MKKLLSVLLLLTLLTSCTGVRSHVDGNDDSTVDPISISAGTDEVSTEMTESDTVHDTHADTEPHTETTASEIVTSDIVTADDTSETEAKTEDTTAHEAVDIKNTIYLTFDDGPGLYTEEVLEILDKYGIKATFFIVGKQALKFPEELKAVASAGHVIACHSMSHDYGGIYKNDISIAKDLTEWENTMISIIGNVPSEHIYRFPGGSTCTAITNKTFPQLRGAVNDLGYRIFDWTCGNNDKWLGDKLKNESLEDYLTRSLRSSLGWCGDIKIMIMHETVAETVATLDESLQYLLDRGYTFATLDTYDGEYLFRRQ